MAYDQVSYLQGYGAAMRVIDGLIGEFESLRREYGGSELTVPAVRQMIRSHEQDNQRLYERIVRERDSERRAAGLGDEPGVQEVARAAWLLVQLARDGCGDMHPDFQRLIRVVENGMGVEGLREAGYAHRYSTATGTMKIVDASA